MGGKNVSQNAPIIASLQLQTSCFGRPVPLVFGQARVSANLIDYDDFTPVANTTRSGGKGGGGVTSTTYTYTAAVLLGVCRGPVLGIPRVWATKQQTTLTDLGLSLFLGNLGQTPPAFMASAHPTKALGYSGTAFLTSPAYDLGSSAAVPSHSFEVNALQYNGTGVTGVPDAGIDQVIAFLLTDPMDGCGFPSGLLSSFVPMASYCLSLGLWVSPAYTDSKPAAQMIDSLCKIGNTAVIFSDGTLKFIPYADAAVSGNGASYTPSTTVQYDFTDDDFIHGDGEEPVKVTRSSTADAFNSLAVTFKDRSQDYASNRAYATDDSSIALNGVRPAADQSFDEICDPAVARMVAQLLLQRSVYHRNTYQFRVSENYARLEPTDIVRLTESTGTGLNLVPVRVTRITEHPDHTLEIEAEDFFGTVGAAPAYHYQSPGGYAADYNADPGNTAAPVIFDAPYDLADSDFELWIAAAGVNTLWGGATVWMSTDGATYAPIGEIKGPARYGVTTGSIGAGADPDTATSIPVDLSISKGTLSNGTATDADKGTTLCLIDREVFAFQTATLTGANKYTLGTYLRRGQFGSARAAHASGAPFVRLDSSVTGVPYDKTRIGTTVYFKFTSFNAWGGGQQDLSTVTAYPYTIQGPIGGIPGDASLIDTKSWIVGGADSQGNYTDNFDGTNHDSAIVLAGTTGNPTGPNGRIVPLWKCTGAGTGPNGGWGNFRDLYGINPAKSYRLTVWFYWNGTGNPTVYFGCGGGYTVQLNGGAATNPYFWSGALSSLGLTANRWYILVGVIHGRDFGNVSSNVSGLYDGVTGEKVALGAGDAGSGAAFGDSNGSEYKWAPSGLVPYAVHRALMYYTNNASANVWFADPRFDDLNGQDPSMLSTIGLAGTSRIGQDAVSAISAATVGSTSISSTNITTNTVLASLVVPYQPFTYDLVLTADGVYNGDATGGGGSTLRALLEMGSSSSGISNNDGTEICDTSYTAAHTARVHFNKKMVITGLPAGGPNTFYCNAVSYASGLSHTGQIKGLQFSAEVRKR